MHGGKACLVGGMHGSGHVWWVVGGGALCGRRGHVWQERWPLCTLLECFLVFGIILRLFVRVLLFAVVIFSLGRAHLSLITDRKKGYIIRSFCHSVHWRDVVRTRPLSWDHTPHRADPSGSRHPTLTGSRHPLEGTWYQTGSNIISPVLTSSNLCSGQ